MTHPPRLVSILAVAFPLAILLVVLVPHTARSDQPAAEGFVPLFDGETLAGWTQRGGEARYRVEDGAIVGSSGRTFGTMRPRTNARNLYSVR